MSIWGYFWHATFQNQLVTWLNYMYMVIRHQLNLVFIWNVDERQGYLQF